MRSAWGRKALLEFQSSPGSREPGVKQIDTLMAKLEGFNPRPAHVSRASRDGICLAVALGVSILARLT